MIDILSFSFLIMAVIAWLSRPRLDATAIFVVYMALGVGVCYFAANYFGWTAVNIVTDITTERAQVMFAALCVCIYISVVVADFVRIRSVRADRLLLRHAKTARLLAVFSITCTLLYILSMASIYGGLGNFLVRVFSRAQLFNSIANYLSVASWGSLILSAIAFYFLPRIAFTMGTILVGMAILLSIGVALSSGGRSIFLLYILSLSFGFLIRLSLSQLMITGIGAAFFILVTSSALVTLRYEAQGAAILNNESEESIFARGTTGLIHVDAVVLADLYANSRGHDFGALYLNTLTFPVPRDLWPEKPLLISTLVREFRYGNINGGNPPGLFGEAYIAFGFFGLFGVSVLLGLALGRMDSFVEAARQTSAPFETALAGIFAPLIGFALIRGGLDVGVMRLGIPLFWCWIARLVAVRLQRLPRVKHSSLPVSANQTRQT